MVSHELIILLFLYLPPYLVALVSLGLAFYKHPSLILFRLIIITLLILVWILSSIPWIIGESSFTTSSLLFSAHIGSIAGSTGRLMLAIIFMKRELGNDTFRLALTSAVLTSILIGMRISELLLSDNSFYGIEKTSIGWVETFHPVVRLVIIISTIALFAAFILAFQKQNELPEAILNNHLKFLNNFILFLFSLGGFFSLLSLFISVYFPSIFYFNFILSRILIGGGFVMLARYVSFDPIFIFQEKGNIDKFIQEGIIGYMVSINADMGPENMIISPGLVEKYKLTQETLISFSASVITVIGVTKSFQNNVFIIPFSGKLTLNAINVTFQKKHQELKDPRFNQIALGVFSIIFPQSLLPKLRTIEQAKLILTRELNKYEDLTDATTHEKMADITIQILHSIII